MIVEGKFFKNRKRIKIARIPPIKAVFKTSSIELLIK